MIIAVEAFAVASNAPIRQLERYFAPAAERVRVTKTTLVVRYAEASWAVAHDFGVLVFIGVADAERELISKQLLASCEAELRRRWSRAFWWSSRRAACRW